MIDQHDGKGNTRCDAQAPQSDLAKTTCLGLHFSNGGQSEALLWGGSIEQAKEVLRRFGEQVEDKRHYRIPYLQAFAVLAQWENKIDQAITHLEAARVLAEQLDLPGELWQILASLGVLYQSCENSSQSQSAFSHAVQLVQSLAGRIEDEEQRTTFLSAQQVRALFTWNTTVQ